MTTPKPLIDDINYMQIRNLGVETLLFTTSTGDNNYQQPETSQRTVNKLISPNTRENIFKIDWVANTAWHGRFSMVAVDVTPFTRGDSYGFEGVFDIREMNGVRVIATPTISQVYETSPLEFTISDLSVYHPVNNPTPEPRFAFQIKSNTNQLLITLYAFIIRLKVGNIIPPV